MKVSAGLFCVLALAAASGAQTMVEYSLGTAAGSTGAAGMKSAGEGIAKALGKAAQALDQANASAQASIIRLPAAERTAKLKLVLPDPARIKIGMDAAQLERDCGSPAMKISGSESVIWWYTSATDSLAVEVLRDKVVSVTPPRPPEVRDTMAKPKTPEEKSSTGDTAVVVLR